jgi:hypothetical protein
MRRSNFVVFFIVVIFAVLCLFTLLRDAQWFPQLDSGNYAEWFGALATTLAVIVALFSTGIQRWLFAPIIDVAIDNSHPYVVDLDNSVYVRLEVSNSGSRARSVEVFMRSFCETGKEPESQNILVGPLTWGDQVDESSSSTRKGILDISSGCPRYCNIAVIDKNGRIYVDTTWPRLESVIRDDKSKGIIGNFELGVDDGFVFKSRKLNYLSHGTFDIEVTVAGENVKPILKTIRIEISNEMELVRCEIV